MRSTLGRFLAAVLIASGLSLAATPAAVSAPAAPGGLSPQSTSVNGIPVLQWNRVARASLYDVQVSTSPGYGSLLWSTTTANRRATPNVQLPGGTVFWRVRARDTSESSAWSETQFNRSALAGPAPLAPADGQVLNPPEEPALTSWQPVNGAVQYTLQVSTDPLFVDNSAVRTYTTQTSSYVVPDPLVGNEYFWRVRATLGSGIVTDWSATRSYRMSGLDKAVLTSPADGATAPPIQDVVLDWQPVPGAQTYDVQISTDHNFNSLDDARNGVMSTRYSPPVTLDNDQYYWRVRPVDAAGNKLDWDDVDVWEFRRNWPFQAQLEYPADGSTVGDPFYYQWSPVKHASYYKVEVATSPDFSLNSMYDWCTTVNTTLAPIDASDCFPQALGHYYWRVIAYDNPGAVVSEAINAEVSEFNYDPAIVTQTSPAPGATVEIPTLEWEPLPGANQYDVTLTRVDNGQALSARTYNTSWTPRSILPAGVEYRWTVRSVSSSGRLGPTLLTGSQPRFTVAASTATPGATPEPVGAQGITTDRFPTLHWTPVTGATRYVLYVRRAGATLWTTSGENFAYAAGEDTAATWLTAGTYDWKVEAWNGSAFVSASVTPGSFVISQSDVVTGHRVALTGTETDSGDTSCTKSLDPSKPLAETQCTGLRATPVLRWDPKPNVAQYVVWLSRDQQLTNLVGDRTYTTEQTAFILPTALIDSQAGSAFYWHVQPCKLPGTCKPPQKAMNAFNKISKPVDLLSPAQGATVANDVTFTWQDFLCTNQGVVDQACTGAEQSADADVEAMQYRLQVDDDPNFQSLLDETVVDQTTYTAFGRTYPEGPLYWRVQAIDGSNNSLTWSAVRTFTKRSPTVTLTSPINNATTSGSAPLRWAPLPYASSYDVEIYRNADTIGQAGNLVYSGNSKQVALPTTVPLPVASASYTWRVRPRDAAGRPGQWTDLADPAARFRVVGTAPTQTAPVNGSRQSATDMLFTWNGVDGATDYRVEKRLVGGGAEEHFRTPGLAWAPSVVGDGKWEWRVVSLDSVGSEIGSSPWWTFSVDLTGPRVLTAGPTGYVKRSAVFKLTFSEKVTGVSKTTFTIKPAGARRKLSAVVKPSADRTRATLNPTANLKRGKVYVIGVTPKVRDGAGNPLAAYEWAVTAK